MSSVSGLSSMLWDDFRDGQNCAPFIKAIHLLQASHKTFWLEIPGGNHRDARISQSDLLPRSSRHGSGNLELSSAPDLRDAWRVQVRGVQAAAAVSVLVSVLVSVTVVRQRPPTPTGRALGRTRHTETVANGKIADLESGHCAGSRPHLGIHHRDDVPLRLDGVSANGASDYRCCPSRRR